MGHACKDILVKSSENISDKVFSAAVVAWNYSIQYEGLDKTHIIISLSVFYALHVRFNTAHWIYFHIVYT